MLIFCLEIDILPKVDLNVLKCNSLNNPLVLKSLQNRLFLENKIPTCVISKFVIL